MSILPDIDNSTGFVETLASPDIGARATDAAIKAARTLRTISMLEELSGYISCGSTAYDLGSCLPPIPDARFGS